MKPSGMARELFLEVLLVPMALALASAAATHAAEAWEAAERLKFEVRANIRGGVKDVLERYCPCAAAPDTTTPNPR